MQIYINKNGQQLGPFDEKTVVEMLNSGEVSSNDLGIKQGEQQWQPLGNLFPTDFIPSAIPNSIPLNPNPAKNGFGCLRLFGIALILLSVVTLIGGLANYKLRNFNEFSCKQAESQKQKVDEAFAKLSPEAKAAGPDSKLSYEDTEKVKAWLSEMQILASWDDACSHLRSVKSFWINVTIGISVVGLLIGIVGLAMVFIPRKK